MVKLAKKSDRRGEESKRDSTERCKDENWEEKNYIVEQL